MRPIFEVFTTAPFEENAYLLGDADAGEAVVIDPGGRAPDIARAAEQRELTIQLLIGTHAHIDHVSGVVDLQQLTGSRFVLHPDARAMLPELSRQALQFGLGPVRIPEADDTLASGQTIEVGDLTLIVREAPGHAPGHIILEGPPIEQGGRLAPFALCGDVIFKGSIGRTDLPGGDYHTLMQSIEREILSLPDETVLYSGHGPATTVGLERRFNAFIVDWMRRRGSS